jgi:hypothetical protein
VFSHQRGFKADRPKTSTITRWQHTLKKHTKQLQTIPRTHKAINKQFQESHEVLQVPTMPNNARHLGLVLFILGSWSAIVVDVFILLDSCFSRNLMEVGGKVAGLSSRWCWFGKYRFCRSSCITSHGCEVFRGIDEVLHIWQCLMPGLKISSQATASLVLDDCKSASPGRNKVTSSTEPVVSTKGKIFVNILLPLQLQRFEDVLLKFAPYCVANHQVYLGTSSNM